MIRIHKIPFFFVKYIFEFVGLIVQGFEIVFQIS